MNGNMVLDTLANGFVNTSSVCLNCLLTFYSKDFGIDLICFPLSQLDVIMGKNWLEVNLVFINCLDKNVLFPEPEESTNLRFIYASQVEMSLEQGDQILIMFPSLRVEIKAFISNFFHMVYVSPLMFFLRIW